jgi:hypothetical protein
VNTHPCVLAACVRASKRRFYRDQGIRGPIRSAPSRALASPPGGAYEEKFKICKETKRLGCKGRRRRKDIGLVGQLHDWDTFEILSPFCPAHILRQDAKEGVYSVSVLHRHNIKSREREGTLHTQDNPVTVF